MHVSYLPERGDARFDPCTICRSLRALGIFAGTLQTGRMSTRLDIIKAVMMRAVFQKISPRARWSTFRASCSYSLIRWSVSALKTIIWEVLKPFPRFLGVDRHSRLFWCHPVSFLFWRVCAMFVICNIEYVRLYSAI